MILIMTAIILHAKVYTAVGEEHGMMDKFKIKPEKCYGSYEVTDRHCCIFPPFFNRVAARECGAKLALLTVNKQFEVSHIRREATSNCKYWTCILRKYKLLNDEEDEISIEKYYNHLDDWAVLNYEFSNVLRTAKMFCRNIFKFKTPASPCDFSQLHNCIRNYINVDCPKVLQTKECNEWKEFYLECKEYFI